MNTTFESLHDIASDLAESLKKSAIANEKLLNGISRSDMDLERLITVEADIRRLLKDRNYGESISGELNEFMTYDFKAMLKDRFQYFSVFIEFMKECVNTAQSSSEQMEKCKQNTKYLEGIIKDRNTALSATIKGSDEIQAIANERLNEMNKLQSQLTELEGKLALYQQLEEDREENKEEDVKI